MLSALFGMVAGDVALLKNLMKTVDLWMGEESGNTQSHNCEHNFHESIRPDPRLSYSGSWEDLLSVKDSLNFFKEKDWVIGRPFPEISFWIFRNKEQG